MQNVSVTPSTTSTINKLYTQVQGTGEHLVLLHGWGMNHGVWGSVAKQLSEHFTVTCVDLPGFGNSHHLIPEPYTLEQICQRVADCIPPQSVLMGWSLGGLIAQKIAIDNNIKLRALVTVGASPKFVTGAGWPGIAPDILAKFQQQLRVDTRATIKRFLAIQAMGSESSKQDIKRIQQSLDTLPSAHPKALENGLELLRSVDLRMQLSAIDIPTLRLYGRLDSLVPRQVIAEIQRLQPSDTFIFDKASHAPFISHQSLFCQQLLSWLSKY